MKALILTALLPLAASAVLAQDPPKPDQPAETVRKAKAAAWLGIAMNEDGGKVTVTEVVPDSPAAKAGLQKGDVLLNINNTPVQGRMDRVMKAVGEKAAGDAIELNWKRGDREVTARIELAERPAGPDSDFRGEFDKAKEAAERAAKEAAERAQAAAERAKEAVERGLKEQVERSPKTAEEFEKMKKEYQHLLDETRKLREQSLDERRRDLELLKQKQGLSEPVPRKERPKETYEREIGPGAFLGIMLDHDQEGKLIAGDVYPDTPAAKAGLQKGDVLLGINDVTVKDDADLFTKTIAGKKPGEAIELRWRRDGKESTTRIELADRRGLARDLAEAKRDAETVKDKLKSLRDEGFREFKDGKFFKFDLDRRWPDDEQADKGDFKPFLRFELPSLSKQKLIEEAVWKRVEDSVARALKESKLDPETIERVMGAVEKSRRGDAEKDERRARLKAEADKLEKEMETLRQRADKLREELKQPD